MPTANAGELLPGASGTPDPFVLGYSSGPPARPVLASLSGTWGSGSFFGQFYEQVENDPANVFCSGCVDFLFQVELSGNANQSLTGVTESGFSAFRAEAGYDTLSVGSATLCGIDDGGFCNSGDPATIPNAVNRSADGNLVGFMFPGVVPGESTVDIVIETNALTFVEPQVTFLGSNGAIATAGILGPSGAPVSPVPEPRTTPLWLVLACAGAVHVKRRIWN